MIQKIFYIFALLISISIPMLNCYGQHNNLPYLTKEESKLIQDKSDKIIWQGDLGSHMTVGEIELRKIVNYNNLSSKNRIELFISILQDNNQYHLHDFVGKELSKITNYDVVLKNMNFETVEKLDYVLLRMNITTGQILSSGNYFELDTNKINALLSIINQKIISSESQRYFIEALYSMTVSQKTGIFIHETLTKSLKNNNLIKYNDSLFKEFQIYKPAFQKLDKIRTWKEMDRNFPSIKEMFEHSHPIMFFQILSFNPSTVLESKKLCDLKQKALINIINSAKSGSFYNTYKLAYLKELLSDKNYNVRFLDLLMKSEDKLRFIKELEEKNTEPNNAYILLGVELLISK